MTGIFLLGVVCLWVWAVTKLTRLALKRFRFAGWRPVGGTAVFAGLLLLPVCDEILGGFQFRALCNRRALLQIDEVSAKGKKVHVKFEPLNEQVPNTALTILYSNLVLRDEQGQIVGTLASYLAKGGQLIRALGISESNSPLTFHGSCSPEIGANAAADKYGFKILN